MLCFTKVFSAKDQLACTVPPNGQSGMGHLCEVVEYCASENVTEGMRAGWYIIVDPPRDTISDRAWEKSRIVAVRNKKT